MTEQLLTADAGAGALSPTAGANVLGAALTRMLPWVVAVVALAAGIAMLDGLPVGVVRDDGMYVVLAKALATGQGYRWINVPGAPAATHYPPGYPAFLALLWRLYPAFPANVLLFKLANVCFNAAAAVLTLRFLRDRWNVRPWPAAAFALVALLGIPTLTLTVIVMSEPLFLALLLAILIVAERVVDDAAPRETTVAILGFAAGAATLVRSQGVALIGAVVVVLVVRRRFRHALVFAAAALLLVAPWQLWSAAHDQSVPLAMRGSYASYGAWLAAGVRSQGLALFPRALGHTTRELGLMFGTLAAPLMPPVARWLAAAAFLALSLAGVRSLRRRAPVTALTLAFYLAIVVLWPFTPARFVWGVWPLVLLPAFLGAGDVLAMRPTSAGVVACRVAVLATAALLVLGYAGYTARGYRGRWWSSIPRASTLALAPMVVWARHTPAGAVLAVEEESTVYLYSGHLALPLHTFTAEQYFRSRTPAEDAAAMAAILRAYPVDLVAATSPRIRQAARLLATARPPRLALVDTFPGGLALTPVR